MWLAATQKHGLDGAKRAVGREPSTHYIGPVRALEQAKNIWHRYGTTTLAVSRSVHGNYKHLQIDISKS